LAVAPEWGQGGGSKGRAARRYRHHKWGRERSGAATVLIAVIIVIAAIVGIVTVGILLCASIRTHDLRRWNDKAWCGRDAGRQQALPNGSRIEPEAATAAERSGRAIGCAPIDAAFAQLSTKRKIAANSRQFEWTAQEHPHGHPDEHRSVKGYPFDIHQWGDAAETQLVFQRDCVADE
jgi:hypothetical protein